MKTLRWLFTPAALLRVWGPILGIAALHYGAPHSMHWVHDVARRLFYVPILLAAVATGTRGGLLAAAVVIVVYLPHAFFQGHGDPGQSSEKLLEMGFYLLIGGLSGGLFDRQAALAERLQEQNALLQRAARLESMGELSAGLAHEIRNPLHAMRGTAEILLDGVPGDAPEHPMGQRLLQEIDRLAGVLTKFLKFAGEQAPDVRPLSTQAVVDRVADLLRAQASAQGVRLVLSGVGGQVSGDEDSLVQVLLAMGLNGLQALDGVASGVLDLQARQDGFAVINNGPEIPQAMIDRIFDPFVSTRTEGTGLGLSVAWRIVQAHQGTLVAENTAEGVRFVIRLPAEAMTKA